MSLVLAYDEILCSNYKEHRTDSTHIVVPVNESNKGNPAARHIWIRQLRLREAWLYGL